MTFKLKADCVFEAENLDEAFCELMQYFYCLHNDKQPTLDYVGQIEISKEE